MGKDNKLKITWLCQGGFLLEADGLRLVVDPYMSDALASRGLPRMQTVPISFDALKPDVVLFTHAHLDHYDPSSVRPIYEKYPKCVFVGPTSAFELFKKDGYDPKHYVVANVGDVYTIGNISVKAIKAYHSDPLAVGYIFNMGGNTVYLSGDTLFEKTLASDVLKAAAAPVDIAIICINGRLGNMNIEEAISVMKQMKPRKAAIPMHYGLFAKNTENPEAFVRKLRDNSINAITFQAGETKEF